MKPIRIVISDDYREYADFIESIAHRFHSLGVVIYKARNEVRKIEHEGMIFVAKRFHNKGILKQIIRSLTLSKGKRSYVNACHLCLNDITTPRPIAYIEIRTRLGLVSESYYICEYSDMDAIEEGLNEHGDFNRSLTEALARFVADIHRKGVIHHDLNSTNIRYEVRGDEYHFSLIDLNRMRFYSPPLSSDKCLDDTTRFSCLSVLYRHFIRHYIEAMGWPPQLFDHAIKIKQRHDRAWTRRKSFSRRLKSLFHSRP
ncbi:MAG: lipopolysaccharide kinase InaA family protein [Lepagella sp.]